MPVASLEGSFDEGVLVLIDIGENSVLVAQVSVAPVSLLTQLSEYGLL